MPPSAIPAAARAKAVSKRRSASRRRCSSCERPAEVGEPGDPVERRAVLVAHQHQLDRGEEGGAVGADPLALEGGEALLVELLGDEFQARPKVGREEGGERTADEVVGGAAVHPRRRRD